VASGSVSLSWSVPANGGSAITGYNVYRGSTSGGEALLGSVGATTTTYTDTAIVTGTAYYYEVTATNGIGESARSNERVAAPATTPAPPVLSLTGESDYVGLSWTAPANGSSAITGYIVYRGTTSGAETLLATVGPGSLSYNDRAVSAGTTYYYRVSATNSVGQGSRSNEKSITVRRYRYLYQR
jgi:fibronectin type 3 domain-containing protein